MTYAQAIEFLYGLRQFGTKLGLENTRRLARLAGDPQDQLRFVHVAGTNGKGSVCAILESVYRASGLRVGMYTSPHLVAFGERIQVGRVPMPEPDVVRWVGRLKDWVGSFDADHPPTFFEGVTVMALGYFHERRCDLVLWETGLGGRLDATNIVRPLVSVITNVGSDHTQWLGSDPRQIALEKAGIIKPGVPVVTGTEPGPSLDVILESARQAAAPLRVVGAEEAEDPALRALPFSLEGDHQWHNAALARAVVATLQKVFPIADPTWRDGLARVNWPGRLQTVARPGDKTLLLDGAHNREGFDALCRHVRRRFGDTPVALILGVLADKDWPSMLKQLVDWRGPIRLVPVASARSAQPAELLPVVIEQNPRARARACRSFEEAWNELANEPVVLVTGSLYLIGEAMTQLGVSTAPTHDERGLNEWCGSAES